MKFTLDNWVEPGYTQGMRRGTELEKLLNNREIERRMAAVIYAQRRWNLLVGLANDLQVNIERLNTVEGAAQYLLEIYAELYEVYFQRHPAGRSYAYDNMTTVLRGTDNDELRDSSSDRENGAVSPRSGERSDNGSDAGSVEVSPSTGVLCQDGQLPGCGADVSRPAGRVVNAA